MDRLHTSRGSSPSQSADSTVSVVVPSYNHALFVQTTLRSILNQTLAPRELLVIDDGSSDGSPKIIEATLKDCSFPCELIARPNRGLCATLNEGLARTSGEYFGYLGSDDFWLPNFLESRVSMLKSRARTVLAYGHAYFIDEHNHIVDCTKDWATYADGDARQMLLRTIGPMSPTVLYRRASLAKEGWNEKARLEDYDLYLRLSTEGEFAFDPHPRAAWRMHGGNISRNQVMMLEEQLNAQRRILSSHFGMAPSEIERLHTEIRFTRAEDFLRIGDKTTALRLISHNLSGATSARNSARMLLRLLIPYRLMERRRLRLQENAVERYGSIHV